MLAHYVNCVWLNRQENLSITGPLGLGKRRNPCTLGYRSNMA